MVVPYYIVPLTYDEDLNYITSRHSMLTRYKRRRLLQGKKRLEDLSNIYSCIYTWAGRNVLYNLERVNNELIKYGINTSEENT